MLETLTQINTLQDGTTTVGEYHDAAIQSTIDTQRNSLISKEANFRATVDLNNLNDQYSDVLALTNSYFADRGLRVAPVRVIDRETLTRAYRVAGSSEVAGEPEGRHVFGRALVVENKGLNEMFGDDVVLGVALHEAAHSLGKGEHFIRTVDERGRNIKLGGAAVHLGGLGKADLRKGTESKFVGDFWEEAFADLTRVRALRAMGRTHDIEGNTSVSEIAGIKIGGVPNGSREERPGVINFPAEFAADSKTIGDKNYIVRGASDFAAYALELLDQRVPGLYDDLLAARQDPTKQRDAIQKIESIQTGLYKRLRDIDYTNEDFITGLKLVQEALEADKIDQQGNPAEAA